MARSILRTEKVQEQKKKTMLYKVAPKVERFLWFQKVISGIPEKKNFHVDEIKGFAKEHDTEMKEIRDLKSSASNSQITKLKVLENLKSEEMSEYTGGLEVPNLQSSEIVRFLREWTGDYNSINLIKTIRVSICLLTDVA
ncbi:hypothetical protein ROZALSC1DRAFT_29769 [Rozella allomycis CSF55]|uniref:Uncharacterized protein n=1 Tax=Rozella allomycis (strain CSF55) TaxID=988480 RepID=A0A075AQU0_ROZAC|nr:hypothetical protein O9G_002712 [Rozella allomycis CSF55]RKP18556.1 hypothetical protein ROZALSC1DRAFT_29769 [Rozella allomycis CSF55]|eukprot:EPZ32626.1 hypothetical protein O9G_002712 [Rozella allomycis CSF55]